MVKTPKKEGSSASDSVELAENVDELLRQAVSFASMYVSQVNDYTCELVRYEIKEGLYRRRSASGSRCSPQLQGHADLTLVARAKSGYGSAYSWRYIVAPRKAGLAATFQRLQQLRAWILHDSEHDFYAKPEYFGLVTDDEEFHRLASAQGFQVIFLRDGELQTEGP